MQIDEGPQPATVPTRNYFFTAADTGDDELNIINLLNEVVKHNLMRPDSQTWSVGNIEAKKLKRAFQYITDRIGEVHKP